MITFTCPHCNAPYQLANVCAGEQRNCGYCGKRFTVPTTGQQVEASDLATLQSELGEPGPAGKKDSGTGPPERTLDERIMIRSGVVEADLIEIECQHCAAVFRVPAMLRGQNTYCERCSQETFVPPAHYVYCSACRAYNAVAVRPTWWESVFGSVSGVGGYGCLFWGLIVVLIPFCGLGLILLLLVWLTGPFLQGGIQSLGESLVPTTRVCAGCGN